MSRLENDVAKPLMTPLIVGERDVSLSISAQRGIANWAYKMALVCEFLSERERLMFFTDDERHAFKNEQLPSNVVVWVGRCEPTIAVTFRSLNRDLDTKETGNKFRLLATTMSVGFLAVQLVAIRNQEGSLLRPIDLNGLRPAPMWRKHLHRIWPTEKALRFPPNAELPDLPTLAERWNQFVKPTRIKDS
jgi:hypothetical protein